MPDVGWRNPTKPLGFANWRSCCARLLSTGSAFQTTGPELGGWREIADSDARPGRVSELVVSALNQIEIAAGVFNHQSIPIGLIVFQSEVAVIEKAEIHPATCFFSNC
jgi:hypothetical protein